MFARPTVSDRFWEKVDKTDGCWLWTASVFQHGLPYGQFQLNGIPHHHRVAWTLVNGPIPDGIRVLHHCDNPPCVNPEHLFLGTDADNNRDMMAKGRFRQGNTTLTAAKGEGHPKHRLTEEQVSAIRSRYTGAWGEQSQLAREFGVSQTTIFQIVNQQRWRSP